MNKNIKRGLVLAALTGGFAALGANAASAIDLGDGTIVGNDVQVEGEAPVTVEGVTVTVLGNSGHGPLLGDGVFVSPGSTLDLFAQQSIETGDVLDDDTQTAEASVPVDASNAWVSVFGKGGSGVIIVPDSKVDGSAATAGTVDGDVVAPVTVDCVTVTVLSDYERDCAAAPAKPNDLGTLAVPNDPAAPAEPGEPGGAVGGDDGAVGNGGNDGAVEGDACVAADATLTADATAAAGSGLEAGLIGAGAVAGGLVALGLIALGRKYSIL